MGVQSDKYLKVLVDKIYTNLFLVVAAGKRCIFAISMWSYVDVAYLILLQDMERWQGRLHNAYPRIWKGRGNPWNCSVIIGTSE